MEEKFVFDTASGFSAEEQQEILNEINSLARENRIAAPREALKTAAKKRGILFPVLVNAAALLLLASGLFLLRHFQSREEADIREGSLVLGLTERKLIQEIRQETGRLIREKEREINDYLARLADAGAEYKELEASVESLTEEQKRRAEYLLKVQDEYRSALTGLQEERARILEDARFRENELRVQAETRVKELSSRIEQSASDLTATQEELSRLSSEQERAARAENQLGGYYQKLNESIRAGDPDNAAAILGSMKEFLNAPSLQGIRSMETRKRSHLAAIDSLELAIAEALRVRGGANVPPADVSSSSSNAEREEIETLQKQIDALENTIRRQQTAIAAFNAQGSETGKLITDYEAKISGLQTQVSDQQQTLNQRDASISALRSQVDGQKEQILERDRRIAALQGQAESLSGTVSTNETTIAELRNQNAALTKTNEDLNRQLTNIREGARQLLQE
jgi:chromosome segregation ATPase